MLVKTEVVSDMGWPHLGCQLLLHLSQFMSHGMDLLARCHNQWNLREPRIFFFATHKPRKLKKIIGKQAYLKNLVKKQFSRHILIYVQILASFLLLIVQFSTSLQL